MRWTRQRLARDRIAGRVERLLSDHRHADERCCSVRQNRVVLTPRRWRQVLRSCVGPTGLGQNLIRRRRWQKSPVTGESSTYAVKTIACGNAGRFRCTRILVCVLPIQSAHEAAGATGTRHSPRPPWAEDSSKPRALRVASTKSFVDSKSYVDSPSFRDGPKDQTSDAQLRIGESRDSGFDASHRPGMTAMGLRAV